MLLSPKYIVVRFGYWGIAISFRIAAFLFKSRLLDTYPARVLSLSPPPIARRKHQRWDHDTPYPINKLNCTQLPVLPHDCLPQPAFENPLPCSSAPIPKLITLGIGQAVQHLIWIWFIIKTYHHKWKPIPYFLKHWLNSAYSSRIWYDTCQSIYQDMPSRSWTTSHHHQDAHTSPRISSYYLSTSAWTTPQRTTSSGPDRERAPTLFITNNYLLTSFLPNET